MYISNSSQGKEKEVSTDETFEDERDKELALLREQVQRQTTVSRINVDLLMPDIDSTWTIELGFELS